MLHYLPIRQYQHSLDKLNLQVMRELGTSCTLSCNCDVTSLRGFMTAMHIMCASGNLTCSVFCTTELY